MLMIILASLFSFTLGFFVRQWLSQRALNQSITASLEAEDQTLMVVESIKDHAIYRLDPQGYIMTWNKGAQSLTGYESNDVLRSHFSRFYRDESKASGLCEFELKEASSTGRFEGEGWRIRKNGTEFWASVVISPIRNADGTLIGFSKMIRDLTERRNNEEDLKKREAQLREAQKIARVGSWEWDVKADQIIWSDEMFKIFDTPQAEFDPSYAAYLQRLDPNRRAAIEKLIADSVASGKDFTFEHEVKQRDGSVKYVQGRGRPVVDSSGQVIRMTGTAQDITDRKQIEDRLLHSQSELEAKVQARTAELHEALEREKESKMAAQAATQAKMQFLANMSHEIRTPMNAILGFSDLLDNDNLTAEQKDYLSRIQTNGAQLLQLIDDILDLSKFEAGKVPLNKADFLLSELIDEAVKNLSSLAHKKGLTIEIIKSPSTPIAIHTDSLRLRQILTNLLSNAIKFSEKGRIRILTDLIKNAENDYLLVIEVEDTGIGISHDQQKKLFQPFMQADGSIARKFGGTGLGLTLSRHIAHALGGDIVLQSSVPGAGSRFQVTLKLDHIPQIPATAPTKASLTTGGTLSISDLNLKRQIRILLAEDSPENEFLVRRYLQHGEIHIDSAKNGLEAIELATQKDYDLVLMDLQMPELDGLEATRRLRAQGFKKPIIAWTAHAFREDKERSLEAGCSGYLTKPVNRNELINIIKTSLETTV